MKVNLINELLNCKKEWKIFEFIFGWKEFSGGRDWDRAREKMARKDRIGIG